MTETNESNVVQIPFNQPEFNQADFVVDDLTQKLVALQKENSLLKASVAQLDGIIKANAAALGLESTPEGGLRVLESAPEPPRAVRRQQARNAHKES